MKAVVILGAGASAGFGVPTLQSIFQDKAARAHLSVDAMLRQKLENAIWKPRGIDIETSDRGLTVEEILTMIRDAEQQEYGWPKVIPSTQTDALSTESLFADQEGSVRRKANYESSPRPASEIHAKQTLLVCDVGLV